MGTTFGKTSRLVTSTDVNSITLNTASIITSGDNGYNGGYQLYISHDNAGCSSSGFYLELKDNISWTYISFVMQLIGVASCWDFNGGGYGGSTGNLYGYDESAGDMVYNCLNSWELSQFQSHGKQSACDNDSNNFLHGGFAVGDPKIFRMYRRRNVNGSLGGIGHGRACNTGGFTLVRDIRIW